MVFASLKHPIRRKILRVLSNGPESFSSLQRQLRIESSHLTYHLEGLSSLLLKTEDGKYALSSVGDAAVSMMKNVEEPSAGGSIALFQSRRVNIWKYLTFLLMCGLIVSVVFSAIFASRYAESETAYNRLGKAYDGLAQAFDQLNTTYNGVNQAYHNLNGTYSQLQDAYDKMNRTLLSLQNSNSEPHMVYDVGTGSGYSTIQEAIDAAQNGSTIVVTSGIYHEHIMINKTLALLGTDKYGTIIDGPVNYEVVKITAENVTLSGFTVNGSEVPNGVELDHSNGSTITGNIITQCGFNGILLINSSNNVISRNVVSFIGLYNEFGTGIDLESSCNNNITSNLITGSQVSAFDLGPSSNYNMLSENSVEENAAVISLVFCNNNTITRNTFADNLFGVSDYSSPNTNFWSLDGKGNYWGDYIGLDDGSGGRVAGDGVGDTNLPWKGVDNYPLVVPPSPASIFWDNHVYETQFYSNSTISAFDFDQARMEISFNVTGPANTTGYFNMSIPTSLLGDSWTITLDNTDVTQRAIITQNQTQSTIYLNYNHSSHAIQVIGTRVIPELSSASTLLFLTISTIPPPIIVAHKRKRRKTADCLVPLSCVEEC